MITTINDDFGLMPYNNHLLVTNQGGGGGWETPFLQMQKGPHLF